MAEGAQRYVRPAVLVANLAGLGIAIYLTVVHYAGAQPYCTVGGAVDCGRVLSSGYGVIGGSGVPTSAAGIAWFAVGAVLAVLRLASPDVAAVRRAQVAWSVIGLLTVVYLVFVEIVQIGAICAWCTGVHALTVLIFLLTVTVRGER